MFSKAGEIFLKTLQFFRRCPRGAIPLLGVWCAYIGTALWVSVVQKWWKTVPVLLVWAAVWLLLALLDALLSAGERKAEEKAFSPKAAVGVLLGADQTWSLSRALLDGLKKGVRMFVFLLLPAIAWEDLGPLAAFRKARTVLADIRPQFLAAYALTELFAAVVLLPAAALYFVERRLPLGLPESVWWAVMLYTVCAVSLTYLVEQIYIARLYLERLRGEERRGSGRAAARAGKKGRKFFRR